MAAIIVNFTQFTGLQISTKYQATAFADENLISTWAKAAVKVIQKSGIIGDESNNRFQPQDTATRAEVAVVLKRLIEYAVE